MSNRCQCQPATRKARDTTARHHDSESIPASSLVASGRSSLSFAYTKSISRFKARQADGTSGHTPKDTKARASQAPLGDGTTDGDGVAVGVGAGGVGAAVGVGAGSGVAVGVGVGRVGVTSIGASIGTCMCEPTWPLASRHRPLMGSHGVALAWHISFLSTAASRGVRPGFRSGSPRPTASTIIC